MPGRDVAEIVHPELVAPVEVEPGERTSELAHVLLAVGAAVRSQGEQLHHLARVVLVRVPARVLVQVEPDDHGRVLRHVVQELLERAEGAPPEELVLVEHQLLLAHAVVRGCEPVVPHERHALHERLVGAHHAVEPPEVVVTPQVSRRERVAVLVGRRRTGERGRAGRAGKGRDGAVQAHGCERLGVTGRRAEAGAPEQTLGLAHAEAAGVDRNRAREAELRRRIGRRRGGRRWHRLERHLALRALLLPHARAGMAPTALGGALHLRASAGRTGAWAALRVRRLNDRDATGLLLPRAALTVRCTAGFGLTAPTAPRGGVDAWVHPVPIGGDSWRP